MKILKWNEKIFRKSLKIEKIYFLELQSMPLRKYVVDKAVNFFNKEVLGKIFFEWKSMINFDVNTFFSKFVSNTVIKFQYLRKHYVMSYSFRS